MKKQLSGILLTLAATVALFVSCRKDYAHEKYKEKNNPITPDLTVKTTADAAGYVMDENDKPVVRAQVIAGNKETLTDEFGYFQIKDASLPEIAGFVKVVKNGYFSGYKTFQPQAGKESFVRIKLVPKNNPGNVDATTGGSVALAGGGTLELPASGVVLASSSTAYTGTVHVAAQWLNPSDIETVQLSSPGDTRGIDKDGHLKLLNTFSMVAVELTNDAGQLLQIAAGKEATITLPISATLRASAPASLPLWSFNETTGLWKQEGTATKSGDNYTGKVSHFSFWTGATGVPLVEFSVRIVNAALQPLAHVAVGMRGASEPFNTGFGRFGFTDADGYATGSILANTSLILNVLTPCETEAYSHSFTSTSSDVDLGTLTGNLGQGMVTITGNAINCSNQPVTNGYVQLYDNGFFNRINIVNGAFNFTGMACTNTSTYYTVIDDNAHQQSAPQTVALVAGVNNLGTLAACGTSTLGMLSYTIDGVTVAMSEPGDQLAAYFLTPGPAATQVLKLDPGQNTDPSFTFQFDGLAVANNVHKVSEVFSIGFPGDRAIAPVPLTVTITEYAGPGGFIAGSFSGLMLDFPANGIHNVSCDFRIRRYQ